MEYHSGGSLPLLGRPRYCPGAKANGGYLCETGHCCGETGCCTYYYELWWFWLLWTVLILFSCCCAYRHRRAKLRVQQQQRQREISLLAYHGASSYPSSMLDLSFLASLKLPSYEEVAAQPSTPPPPYSSVFTTPRYPQPPRTSDPHLLTQHGPLLHRRLSDGPSSFSSDNSSSCSCDSCCPSSPCSSSISAPVTYETDTSHATTPSEAAPLTLEVTMESIAAAVSCLEVDETPLDSERMSASVAINVSDEDAARLQEPITTGSLVSTQTVSASPHSLPSSGSERALHVGTTSPTEQLEPATTCTPTACSPSSVHSPSDVDTKLPSIQITNTEDPAHSSKYTLAPEINLMSSPSTPAGCSPDSPTATQALDLIRTFETDNVPSSPNPLSSPDVGRTFALMPNTAGLTGPDPSPVLVLLPAPLSPTRPQAPVHSDATKASIQKITNLVQAPNSVTTNLTQVTVAITTSTLPDPELILSTTTSVPNPLNKNISQAPRQGPLNLTVVPNPQLTSAIVPDSVPNPASISSTLTHCQSPELSQRSVLVPGLTSPRSGLPQQPRGDAAFAPFLDPAVSSGPSLVHSQLSNISGPIPPNVEGELASCSPDGSGSAPVSGATPVLGYPTVSVTSCPAITVESEPPLFLKSSSSALSSSSPPSPSSPSSIPSPPALCSISLPATALLLDPLTVPHQTGKGEPSCGQATSLSPSPRATQSPPKQTLFSPCVDVFEPVPHSWEDDEEEPEEDGNEDDDDDMGADESQYRHRRLTGDSGIEVCRCQVEEEDEEEEEEDGSGRERKEDGRRGEKKGGGAPDLHDSVDCAARSQISAGDVTVCNPTSATAPTSEDGGKAVIVMETV